MTQAPRVLVTRAEHQAGKLSSALRALGFEPVEVPVLEIRPPESFEAIDTALNKLAQYDWLILTSANTVLALVGRAQVLNLALGSYPGQIAVVGEATAARAGEAGLKVSLVPEKYVAESLVEALRGRTAGKRILLARAAQARDVIPDDFRNQGAEVDVVDAYRNSVPERAPEQLREALRQGIAAVTFTSSSSVTHLAEVAKQAGLPFPFAGVRAVSIGPITTETLRAHKWEPDAEANPFDISALAAAVRHVLSMPKM